MSKNPLERRSRKTTAPGKPASGDIDTVMLTTPVGGFVSFRWSCTEVSSQGGRTHVKATQIRLDRGKLAFEAFEGELGAELFDPLARQAQRQVLAQTAWLTRSLFVVAADGARGAARHGGRRRPSETLITHAGQATSARHSRSVDGRRGSAVAAAV